MDDSYFFPVSRDCHTFAALMVPPMFCYVFRTEALGRMLALVLPNWLEDRGRRKLTKGRYAMIAVIAVGVVAVFLAVSASTSRRRKSLSRLLGTK